MASPPFNPNEAVPADASLVSAFPAAERTFRDIIESWLLIEHGRSGHHAFGVLSTAARDAITDWEVGSVVYNTTTDRLEVVTSIGPVVWVSSSGFTAFTAATIFDEIKQAATATYTGVVELATDAETLTGTDTVRAITPANLAAKLVDVTASQAEMEAGTATNEFVTPGRQHFHPGHPKAGGNLNGTGTPAFRAGDYGMGAVTDHAQGEYTVAFDTSFADTNYWVTVFARSNNDSSILGGFLTAEASNSKATGSMRFKRFEVGGGSAGGTEDSSEMGMTFWGDYA